jgi:hypothetical protein
VENFGALEAINSMRASTKNEMQYQRKQWPESMENRLRPYEGSKNGPLQVRLARGTRVR